MLQLTSSPDDLSTAVNLFARGPLADSGAAVIALRLSRLAYGQFGDAEPVGHGISELRIHYGPAVACT